MGFLSGGDASVNHLLSVGVVDLPAAVAAAAARGAGTAAAAARQKRRRRRRRCGTTPRMNN
jgi:hypothetical protein